MFVRKKIHLSTIRQLELARISVNTEKFKNSSLLNRVRELEAEVRRLQNKLNNEAQVITLPFNNKEISKLLILCHPDKHDGKPSAVEMTQKLIKVREAYR